VKVGNGGAEVLDLALHRVRSPYLSRLAVRVPADEVRVEDLVDDLHLALAESLLQYAPHVFLVLFGHRDLPSHLLLPVPNPTK
jgi:hypothetical protein